MELGWWPRDRVVLIACWTVSIFIGSVLKDRRLTRSLGEDDRAYQARVPGYPGIPFGPLARRPSSTGVPLPRVSLCSFRRSDVSASPN